MARVQGGGEKAREPGLAANRRGMGWECHALEMTGSEYPGLCVQVGLCRSSVHHGSW